MSLFERWLTLWVFLCIAAGIALHQVRSHLKGIGVTQVVNWLVKPFSIAFLAWLFIREWFAPWLSEDEIGSYVAGLVLLAVARTRLPLLWSQASTNAEADL